jgi:CBS domain-containing protein
MKRNELRVADIMSTALTTIHASDPVLGAHAEMQVGVIRHLPVVDDRGRLVGVVSDRDVLRALGSKRSVRVADIMSRDLVTAQPDDPAHAAASLMLEHNISSVLVVDDASTLVGVVTMTDYVDLARRSLLGLPLER